MPNIIDATVVNSAYDTSGNGGRKLVRLDNGWLVVLVQNGGAFYLYKSTDNALTWSQLCSFAGGSNTGVSIVSKGTIVHILVPRTMNTNDYRTYSYSIDATTQTNVDISSVSGLAQAVETSVQTAIGLTSLTINEAGTELHATWASKNATYPNSFNIRYAKGTINADGSVTWGAVEQVTTVNTTGSDCLNPTITVKDNIPFIAHEYKTSTPVYVIMLHTKAYTTKNAMANASASWGNINIYNGSGYAQSSPSAIFVPQSINGLANGRIWVAWHGKDATDTTVDNVRISYSDDGGATWSTMQKLTSGNTLYQSFASITANNSNEVFVVWQSTVDNTYYKAIKKIKYNGAWGSVATVKSISTSNNITDASTLYDLSVKFSEPLFIYKNPQETKVGFYGTWTVTTISVQQGDIGTKSDKSNLLTYSITTDGTMSTITEKVNDVIVGTKTATSGQSLIAGLTQAQWDAIKFGKYADATGGKNTLTVEMGSEKWTYTFDKRLATDADILSAVKATQDTQNTFLPAVKAKLASAVRGKGGTVNDTDSWDAMVSAVASDTRKRWASGISVPSSTSTFLISGLDFVPTMVVGMSGYDYTFIANINNQTFGNDGSILSHGNYGTATMTINGGNITISVSPSYLNTSKYYEWFAIE